MSRSEPLPSTEPVFARSSGAPGHSVDSTAMQPVAAAVERLGALADSPRIRTLAERFQAAGFELALVGGPVRDAFLGRESHDLDFTSSATPDEILSIVAPIADAHWDIGRAFGTIGARFGALTVELTTYRADAYDGLTRNAMALRLPEKVLVDPSGGLDDLLAKRLRTPIEPEVSFGDDPLRMLRGARFTAQLGFALDPAAASAIQAMADRIAIVSAER